MQKAINISREKASETHQTFMRMQIYENIYDLSSSYFHTQNA